MAYRYSFFDPFASVNISHSGTLLKHAPSPLQRAAHVPETYSIERALFRSYEPPKYTKVDGDAVPSYPVPEAVPIPIRSDKSAKLVIKGQGAIAVLAKAASELLFTLSTPDEADPKLFLRLSRDACSFSYGTNFDVFSDKGEKPTIIDGTPLKRIESCYLVPGVTERYWLSLDRKNGVLKYGKTYLNSGMTLYESVLKKMNTDGVPVWVDPKWEWLDRLTDVEVMQSQGDSDALRIIVQPLPLVNDLPPFIVSDQQVTLMELEAGLFTVPENLPIECQKLYHNVAGPNILLDAPDFPDFSAAIERSVSEPGLLGYKLLKKKAGEFGKENFAGTYLRITIGRDQGNSPGVPYVLEIWPYGHYSPIHDHGDSFAVIKVLHGSVNAYFYDSLNAKPGPHQLRPPAQLKKGDITWISNQNYQVHKLYNEADDPKSVCCTIQCYQYGTKDTKHYEFFRFLGSDDEGQPETERDFTPGSDMAFGEFRRKIKEEWEKRN